MLERLKGLRNSLSRKKFLGMGMFHCTVSITASVETDPEFVAMMVPYHQCVIEMAQAELRYGRNVQLGRIAQEIVVEKPLETNAAPCLEPTVAAFCTGPRPAAFFAG
ncbi:DUF305 domain-containing protein [Paraburkholderia sp. BL6669N2]|uniref:DUF305 domain-containing protein n=1 Tax=Paraburkholderia sp. BL6669N2 TaxID=1938807 RepID=UPI00286879A0|nr:DUF305 domain-containing protein [Paraburkholderia sp. BL6669N2]